MTREEQIFSAADAAYDLEPDNYPISFEKGFKAGVKWSEENSGYEDNCLYAEEIIAWMGLPELPKFN